MDSVSYNDSGDWPVGPDGSGMSLAKINENGASDGASNWTASAQLGGTPGAANSTTAAPLPAVAPITLAFNELAPAGDPNFWLELVNYGNAPVSLEGVGIDASTGSGSHYLLPAQSLAPGDHLVVNAAQLGVTPVSGDKLFLFSADGSHLLDAVVAKTASRGRLQEGTGAWYHPSQPTPGAVNTFALHDEIVINEIMYDTSRSRWIRTRLRPSSGSSFTTRATTPSISPGGSSIMRCCTRSRPERR